MATMTFRKAAPSAPTPSKPANARTVEAELAPAAATRELAAPRSNAASAQLQGDWGASDVATPYLTICQKSGQLFDEMPEALGKWVFDKSVCLGDTMRGAVFTMVKYFVEDRPFGDSQIPQRWESVAEARASGLAFKDVADIHILVEMPLDDAPQNAFEHGGKAWVPAKYTVRSTAFGRTVKPIMRDLPRWLNGDFASGVYAFGVEKKVANGNSYYTPTLRADGPTPGEVREYINAEFAV